MVCLGVRSNEDRCILWRKDRNNLSFHMLLIPSFLLPYLLENANIRRRSEATVCQNVSFNSIAATSRKDYFMPIINFWNCLRIRVTANLMISDHNRSLTKRVWPDCCLKWYNNVFKFSNQIRLFTGTVLTSWWCEHEFWLQSDQPDSVAFENITY